MKIWNITA